MRIHKSVTDAPFKSISASNDIKNSKKTPKKIIEVKGLYKIYNGFKAVNNISFDVYEGEIFGIVGPSGAGKTTLVECIEGLRTPNRGSIKILGLNVLEEKTKQRIKQHIGIQLQEGKLPDMIKVLEAVKLFASFCNQPLSPKPLLKYLGLIDKSHSYFETLSGGQKQRLFIAMALIGNPKILFLDELTTGLDPHSRRKTWDLVKKIRDDGKTIILTTHFMEEAELLCDRVAIIDNGKIIALDTPTNLIQNLGAKTQIMVSVDDLSVVSEFEKINNISKIEQNMEQIIIHSNDSDKVIEDIFSILIKNDIHFYNFSVNRPNLEDVFLSLTGKRIRD